MGCVPHSTARAYKHRLNVIVVVVQEEAGLVYPRQKMTSLQLYRALAHRMAAVGRRSSSKYKSLN